MYQTPEKIYQLKKADILKLKGFHETLADRIVNKENKQCIDKQIENMEKEKVKIITKEYI